jgi:hypothetical protein
MRSSKTAGGNVAGEGPKKKPLRTASSGTVQKPAARAASESQPAKKAAPAAAAAHDTQRPGQDTIDRMVAEAAYYLAEKRAFAPGFEEQDWQAAKDQITAQLHNARNPLGSVGQ